LILYCAAVAFYATAAAQPAPVLTWITNSSVKLEQVIGDVDWANGSNIVSQTITRVKIEGTDISSSFVSGTNRIFIFGDTIGSNADYHAADPVAWSTTTNGEQGLRLNFFTNSDGSDVFVKPIGRHLYFQCELPHLQHRLQPQRDQFGPKTRGRLFRAGHV
jgi:hypothetical protein